MSEPSRAQPLDKNLFSSLFILPRIKSLRKQGTGNDLINTQFDLHYELMSVPRGSGGMGRERLRWYSDEGDVYLGAGVGF